MLGLDLGFTRAGTVLAPWSASLTTSPSNGYRSQTSFRRRLPNSAICTPARLAVAIATLPGDERIGLVSIESAGKASERVPKMVREIQQYCGADLPYIVGADLTTWWDSETTVFGDMMQIGLPLIGPHTATLSTARSTGRNRPTRISNSTMCSRPGQSPIASPSAPLTIPMTGGPAIIVG